MMDTGSIILLTQRVHNLFYAHSLTSYITHLRHSSVTIATVLDKMRPM